MKQSTNHRLHINTSNKVKTLILNQWTLTKIKQTLERAWYFSKHNGNNTLTESRKAYSKHGKWIETEKTHTFFLKIGEEMVQKWSLRSVWVSFNWERNGEDNDQSQKVEGKTEKVLKTVFEMQNTRFSWLKQVVRASRQNIQSQNYEKNF